MSDFEKCSNFSIVMFSFCVKKFWTLHTVLHYILGRGCVSYLGACITISCPNTFLNGSYSCKQIKNYVQNIPHLGDSPYWQWHSRGEGLWTFSPARWCAPSSQRPRSHRAAWGWPCSTGWYHYRAGTSPATVPHPVRRWHYIGHALTEIHKKILVQIDEMATLLKIMLSPWKENAL